MTIPKANYTQLYSIMYDFSVLVHNGVTASGWLNG